MTDTKYGKYFTTYEAKPEEIELGRTGIARLTPETFKESAWYWVHWNLPRPADAPVFNPGVGHPPHMHKEPEILILIGTNPDDPTDLGAEVEMQMGMEREKHIITKSTLIYIPPLLVHCPWIIRRTDRPWVFVEVNQGPHTEKLVPEILTEEEKKNVDWSKCKEEGF